MGLEPRQQRVQVLAVVVLQLNASLVALGGDGHFSAQLPGQRLFHLPQVERNGVVRRPLGFLRLLLKGFNQGFRLPDGSEDKATANALKDAFTVSR